MDVGASRIIWGTLGPSVTKGSLNIERLSIRASVRCSEQ